MWLALGCLLHWGYGIYSQSTTLTLRSFSGQLQVADNLLAWNGGGRTFSEVSSALLWKALILNGMQPQPFPNSWHPTSHVTPSRFCFPLHHLYHPSPHTKIPTSGKKF